MTDATPGAGAAGKDAAPEIPSALLELPTPVLFVMGCQIATTAVRWRRAALAAYFAGSVAAGAAPFAVDGFLAAALSAAAATCLGFALGSACRVRHRQAGWCLSVVSRVLRDRGLPVP